MFMKRSYIKKLNPYYDDVSTATHSLDTHSLIGGSVSAHFFSLLLMPQNILSYNSNHPKPLKNMAIISSIQTIPYSLSQKKNY
jgi:hypothetical protein